MSLQWVFKSVLKKKYYTDPLRWIWGQELNDCECVYQAASMNLQINRKVKPWIFYNKGAQKHELFIWLIIYQLYLNTTSPTVYS